MHFLHLQNTKKHEHTHPTLPLFSLPPSLFSGAPNYIITYKEACFFLAKIRHFAKKNKNREKSPKQHGQHVENFQRIATFPGLFLSEITKIFGGFELHF
jgi:hypothetical protein